MSLGRPRAFGACATALALLGGCARPHVETLTVSAAISLSEPLSSLAHGFEASHPGTHVALNLGASGDLARQIEAGAPADLFASADDATMDRLDARHLVVGRRVIARNKLVLVVRGAAGGTASGIRFASLGADPRVRRLAIGAPESVPAGRYAMGLLAALGQKEALAGRIVYGANVRQVLDYVARGEVDAGIVYRTDVAPDRGVVIAEVAEGPAAPLIRYPMAQVAGSSHAALASAFLDLVAGPEGLRVLGERGFLAP